MRAIMRTAITRPLLHSGLIILGLTLIVCGLLYSHNSLPWSKFKTDWEEDCADCVNYAGRIDKLIRETDRVEGNPQFFRYAADVSCRGSVLASGRCPNFRRRFLKDPDRFMREIQNPYEACVSIQSCH